MPKYERTQYAIRRCQEGSRSTWRTRVRRQAWQVAFPVGHRCISQDPATRTTRRRTGRSVRGWCRTWRRRGRRRREVEGVDGDRMGRVADDESARERAVCGVVVPCAWRLRALRDPRKNPPCRAARRSTGRCRGPFGECGGLGTPCVQGPPAIQAGGRDVPRRPRAALSRARRRASRPWACRSLTAAGSRPRRRARVALSVRTWITSSNDFAKLATPSFSNVRETSAMSTPSSPRRSRILLESAGSASTDLATVPGPGTPRWSGRASY